MKEEEPKNLNIEHIKALFDGHVSAVVVSCEMNRYVNTLVLQVDTNGLGLQSGIRITALVDIEGPHAVGVLIPSHHFHRLRILEEIIQHQLKLLDTKTRQYAHNYLLNKNQLNLFTHA